MKGSHAVLLCGILLLLSPNSIAQTGTCPAHIAVASVFHRGLHQDPAPIANLTAEDFRASARSKPVVRTAEYHAQPATAVLLLDVGHNPKTDWKSALAVATDLIMALSPTIELDLITFSDRVEQKFLFQRDRQSFLSTLSQLTPVGHRSSQNGLLAAVSEGFAALNPPHPGDVEIFISAAPATESKEKHEQQRLEQLLSSSGVRLFGVGLTEQVLLLNGRPTSGIPLKPSEVDEHSEFVSSSELLAYDTGGMFLPFMVTPKSSKPPARRLEAEFMVFAISNFYVLDLDISQSIRQNEQLRIELRNGQLAGATLLWHPARLYPCPKPAVD